MVDAGVACAERDRRPAARHGTVLAAGGFIHNPEMLKRHAPELYPCSGHWGRAGDLGMGIRMGMGVGANVLRMHHGFAVLPLYPPENVLKGVAVNRLAQRCIAEDAYYGAIGHEFLYNQGGRGWLIVDAGCDYPGPDARVVVAAHEDDIATLGRALGFAPGALETTIDFYNRHYARRARPPLARARRISPRLSVRRSRPTIWASRRRSTRCTLSAGSRPRSRAR
jgi:hypothetical protein